MPINSQNAPPRELVKAYTLTFNDAAAKVVLADLETFVEVNMASQKDKLGRIDPFQVIAQEAARRVLQRIRSLSKMSSNPDWLRADAARQAATAEQRL